MSASLNLFDDDDVGKSRRKNNTITNEGQASNLLMVGKESFKIRKTSQQPSTPMKTKPVVIYVVPPKVIHAEASEFMDVVQRLTAPMCPSSHDPQDDAQQRSNESKPMSPEQDEEEPLERRRYQEEESDEKLKEAEQKGGRRRLVVKNYMGRGGGVETQTHYDDSLQPPPTTIPSICYFDVFRKND